MRAMNPTKERAGQLVMVLITSSGAGEVPDVETYAEAMDEIVSDPKLTRTAIAALVGLTVQLMVQLAKRLGAPTHMLRSRLAVMLHEAAAAAPPDRGDPT